MDNTLSGIQGYLEKEHLYESYRPGYPSQICDDLVTYHSSRIDHVADIGAGTGMFSEMLLNHGFNVTAIEPNQSMTVFLKKRCSRFSRLNIIQETAEQISLASDSVDVVTFAQSFHWCDNAQAISEVKRILKPYGSIILCWNERSVNSDGLHSELEGLLLQIFPKYSLSKEFQYNKDSLQQKFLCTNIARKQYENFQIFDLRGLIGRFASTSFFDRKYEIDFLKRITDLFYKYQTDGKVKIVYQCEVFFLHFQ
jgi:SAM-dependent methyltransferase